MQAQDLTPNAPRISFKWYTLIIICLTQILCPTDGSIMINTLSSLVKSFHSSVSAVQLANSVYLLVAGALMLAGGLLGLKLGWKYECSVMACEVASSVA